MHSTKTCMRREKTQKHNYMDLPLLVKWVGCYNLEMLYKSESSISSLH